MDTPITISSTTSTEKKSPHNESVYSLDSSSIERIPVSWEKGKSSTPFSHVGKVRRWMGDIEATRPLDDRSDIDLSLSPSYVDTPSTGKSDNKSLILVRCDFNKTLQPPQKKCYNTIQEFEHATYLQYLRDKSLSKTPKSMSKSPVVGEPRNVAMKRSVLLRQTPDKSNFCGYSSPVDRKFSIDRNSYPMIKQQGERVMEDSSEPGEVPMSPESRKKELCTYLQLMDPADKKEILILQNRRSTRVRNLAAMQEKKQLEKQIMHSKEFTAPSKEIRLVREFKLSEELIKKRPKPKDFKIIREVNSVKEATPKLEVSVENPRPSKEEKLTQIVVPFTKEEISTEHTRPQEKYEMLKSFKELNIELEKFMEKVAPEEEEKSTFCFPFPPKELTEETVDFDVLMSELVPKYKKTCRLKGLKLHSSDNATAKVNKENLKDKSKEIKQKISHPKQENNNKLDYTSDSRNQMKSKQQHIVPKPRLRPNILRKSSKKNSDRVNNLRSNKDLSNVSFKKLATNDSQLKAWKIIKKREMRDSHEKTDNDDRKSVVSKTLKEPSPQVEIVTIKATDSDLNVDLENLMDDMIDFKNLSEEHKRCLIESRIFSADACRLSKSENATSATLNCSVDGLTPFSGFSKTDARDAEKISEACHIAALKEKRKSVDARKSPQGVVANGFPTKFDSTKNHTAPDCEASMHEHDYAGLPNALPSNEDSSDVDVETVPSINLPVDPLHVDTRSMLPEPKNGQKYELVPFTKPSDTKSLHKSLQLSKRKSYSGSIEQNGTQGWDSDNGTVKLKEVKKQSHSINIAKESGNILKAFYVDYNLVICQESCVSFWMQTSLGHVLGSQNMWIPRGRAQRITLNQHKCIQKESMEMVVSTETTVAYVELWTKEHQSEIRQGPVADVFATVYFWKQRQNGVEKKVLQLQNINGFADDVQYSVMKCLPKIVVSWHCASDDNLPRRTLIHCYHMAADYQTVSNIQIIEPVQHYVSSLHNIEDCENLMMGCGENKITLWNIEHGYKIATIELSEIKTPLSTLWVKCDRGFLFALQQCVDKELRLIAINGLNNSWKKLASYYPPKGFDRLRGVCIENGMLLSFYDKGVICWNAETGEPLEEIPMETELIPAGKYVIFLEDTRVFVKHVMTHLMSISADDT